MKPRLPLIAFFASLVTCLVHASPLGTAFTYQGRLNEGVNPANGSYVFRFTVYDAAIGGGAVGTPITNSPVNVSNGLFTVALDFGTGVFTGADRWLGIEVHTNDGLSAFVALAPRQPITPAPYALLAGGVTASGITGTMPASSLGGSYTNAVNLTNANNAFAGNGVGLTNVNAAKLAGLTASNFWQTGGNAGTTPGLSFLGTTDNKPLELRANKQRLLLLDYRSGSPNVLGGHPSNTIAAGVSGVTIAGGGEDSIFGSYYYNSVNSSNGTISGGYGGYIGTNSAASTIAGGKNSFIGDNADHSVISGGRGNGISTDAYQSVIAGGQGNGIGEFSTRSTISGGSQNEIGPTNFSATIAGGQVNRIYAGSRHATISGGYINSISTSERGVIGGGYDNMLDGAYSAVISGGYGNWLWNAPYATITGGNQNWIDGAEGSTISGGGYNEIRTNALYATIPGGAYVLASSYGQFAYSGGSFGGRGDSQSSLYVLRGVTTNATVTELFLEGTGGLSVSNRMMVPLNGVWTFDILVVATVANATQLAGYQIKGLVSHQPADTTLFGITVTPLYEDVGAWDANVVADSAHGALGIVVKGSAGTTVRWVASVRTVELIHN